MLKIIGPNGYVYFGSFTPGSRRWVFEKLISKGKPVPVKDGERIAGNQLAIFCPHLVSSKLVLSDFDASGQKEDMPALMIVDFKLPPTIITINTADEGVYKLTYVPSVVVLRWVLTKIRDFQRGVGTFEIPPDEQERNCCFGNTLKFAPGEMGGAKIELSRNAEPVFTIEMAMKIDIEYLL